MSPTNRNLSHRVDGRLAAYATLAGVALAAPAFAPNADANVVYSVVNLNIPLTTNGLYLNVQTYPAVGSINEPGNTAGGTVPGWDINPFGSTTLSFFSATSPAFPTAGTYVQRTGGGGVANLPVGTLIDITSAYGSNAANSTGNQPFLLNSNQNFVGFRFFAADGLIHYGWMQISVGATFTSARSLVAFAWEDVAGVGIQAGVVPEPTTFALLGVMAAGAFGVRAWRKRKVA